MFLLRKFHNMKMLTCRLLNIHFLFAVGYFIVNFHFRFIRAVKLKSDTAYVEKVLLIVTNKYYDRG